MEPKTPCPICGAPAEHYREIEAGVVCEDGISCDACGYEYEFSYGATRVSIGNDTITWGWQDTPINRMAHEYADALEKFAKEQLAKEQREVDDET